MPPASAPRSPSGRWPIRAPASGACPSSSATRASSRRRWHVAGTSLAIRRIGSVADAVGTAGHHRRPRRRRHRHGDPRWGRLDPQLRRRRRPLDEAGRDAGPGRRHRRHGVCAAQQGGDARGRARLRRADGDPRRHDRQQAGHGDGGGPDAAHAVHQPHGAARGVRIPAHRSHARTGSCWRTPRCATWASPSRRSPSRRSTRTPARAARSGARSSTPSSRPSRRRRRAASTRRGRSLPTPCSSSRATARTT